MLAKTEGQVPTLGGQVEVAPVLPIAGIALAAVAFSFRSAFDAVRTERDLGQQAAKVGPIPNEVVAGAVLAQLVAPGVW